MLQETGRGVSRRCEDPVKKERDDSEELGKFRSLCRMTVTEHRLFVGLSSSIVCLCGLGSASLMVGHRPNEGQGQCM